MNYINKTIVIATNNGINNLKSLLKSLDDIRIEYKIAIVDTQSCNQDSLDFLSVLENNNPYNLNIKIFRTEYRGYDSGAYLFAMNNIDSDFYYFIQDSIIIKSIDFFDNINLKLKDGLVVPLITFKPDMYDNQEEKDFCYENFKTIIYSKGIFGPMFSITKNDVIKINNNINYPINKNQQMAMERGWGIIFDKYNINIDSLEGDYNYDKIINNEYKYFEKKIVKRS